jgi:blue copper oxidase
MRNLLTYLLSFALSAVSLAAFAQTPVPVPPLLSGNVFELTVQAGATEFFPGIATNTVGYNGAYLGPTLLLEAGQEVQMVVHNQLDEPTTVHWHGLHVAPTHDGSPHTPIAPGQTWSPAFPILDRAATYWYHPHPHGKTMEQVLLGAAGFIIVRDGEEAALNLPRTYGVDDVPLAFQFKTFDAQKQIVLADEADNDFLINGVRNGILNSPAQVVRYRLLNGSSHRYFRFGFADNRPFHQIASDAGLLDAPVALTRLNLGPGERAEILLDLSGEQGQTLQLRSFGQDLPTGYPGGSMMMGGMMGPLDDTNFDVLTIHVTAPTADPVTAIPAALTSNNPWPQFGAGIRNLTFTAQPMMSMDNFFINGSQFDMETISFTTEVGRTEVWNLNNQTMMAHPFHLHGNTFYVLAFNAAAPPPSLQGRKDVVTVPPMGSVKIITRYEDYGDPEMPFMFHCHILSHEDNGMMGQFIVNPAVTATHEPGKGNAFRLWPNPVQSDHLYIAVQLSERGKLRFLLIDAAGRRIRTVELGERGTGEETFSLDVTGLPAGTYFLEARLSEQLIGSQKVSVK